MRAVAALGLVLMLAGCLSPGESDRSVIWELCHVKRTSTVRVTVVLPTELRRPTVVTYDDNRWVNHDFDRWAAPLSEALARKISHDLDGQPVQDLVVDIQRLEVGMRGELGLTFVAKMRLMPAPAAAGAPFTVIGQPLNLGQADDVTQTVEDAVSTYTIAAQMIAQQIAEAVAKEQGGVAKPTPGVTVPGK